MSNNLESAKQEQDGEEEDLGVIHYETDPQTLQVLNNIVSF